MIENLEIIKEIKMRKILALLVTVLLLLGLCSCNESYGLGSFEFKKIHIDTDGYSGCLTVEKWYDNDMGVEVKTKEVGYLYLSEGTYILIGDTCPICTEVYEENRAE